MMSTSMYSSWACPLSSARSPLPIRFFVFSQDIYKLLCIFSHKSLWGFQMPRKYNLDQLILRLLENGDLSRREIAENIRKVLGRPVSDKSINEALMKLLRDDNIQVIDYDIRVYDGVERIQSIKADGIVFTLVKKDPFEISMLFKKMESDDAREAERAFKKLKRFFMAKMTLLGMRDYTLFSRIMHEIFLMNPQSRDKIIQKLSWALSDEKDSLEEFREIVHYFRMRRVG